MSITYGGDYITDTDGGKLKPSSSVMRNRIINGAMVIDQRNAGASVTQTTSGLYCLDRWQIYGSVASKFTVQQSSTAPTGFVNSALITSSSAYTVGSGEFFVFQQAIEGLNLTDLGWGTANAQPITLSFKVRSSLTGTFGGAITNSANNRSYPFTFTISSANTYEDKTVTIAGDTSGTWLTTNGIGLTVRFSLGTGSTYSGTAGTWAGTLYTSATGATSVVGTSGATFYITGVQLEVGSSATGFEYRQYGQELALCQRYFYMIATGNAGGAGRPISLGVGTTNTQISGQINFPSVMRADPSIYQNTGAAYYDFYSNGSNQFTSFKIDQVSTQAILLTNNSALTSLLGKVGVIYSNNASGYLAFNSEL